LVLLVVLVAASASAPVVQWEVVFLGGESPRVSSFGTVSCRPETSSIRCEELASAWLGENASWRVIDVVMAHVRGSTGGECVLLVRRPWQDWPIQLWSSVPSGIAGWHDDSGESCHVIVLDIADGREVWAGSALPAPMIRIHGGDLDGDGLDEVLALEGRYGEGDGGPVRRVDVWGWNGFGFSLKWHSDLDKIWDACLTDVDRDGRLEVAIR
jgi:hypothetical protein